ncbi:hypothetical protein ACKA0G_28370 (plasmid) [Priestia megaterium]
MLVKSMFLLSLISVIVFSFILKQGLTALLVSAIFIALAGIFMKTKPTNKESS